MRNEGMMDRVLRGIAGLALLGLALVPGTPPVEAPWAIWVGGVVGAVLLLTAATGFCPAYRLLGVKTCRDR